ncbi:MAG: OmpA family protein [Magnetococcus sp. DMHC-8]
MKNLKTAMLAGAALLFAAAPTHLDAAAPGQWSSGGFTQWHASDGRTSLGVSGTQCYFCKPDPAPAPPPAAPPVAAAPVPKEDKCANAPNGATLDSRGCWVLKNLNFKTDSAQIEPKDMGTVKEAAKVLKQNPNVGVEVQGHTDNVGTPAYNKRLSDRRAHSVMNSLVKHGVNKQQVTARGYGLEKPIASNDTVQGRSENRRVELSVTSQNVAVEKAPAPAKKPAAKKKSVKKKAAKQGAIKQDDVKKGAAIKK